MKRRTGPTQAQRDAVLLRARNHCERCTQSVVDRPADIHHRCPRGMGGSGNPRINDVHLLVLLCRGCHEWVEKNRGQAKEGGWLLSYWLMASAQMLILTDTTGAKFRLIEEQRIDL